MKRNVVLAAAVVAIFAAIAIAFWRADLRARGAESDAAVAQQQAKEAQTIAAAEQSTRLSTAAVARETVKTIERVRVIERAAAPAKQEISAHASAATPIDPALARDWVSGLKRLCDSVDAAACADADPDRAGPGATDEPVPAWALARR